MEQFKKRSFWITGFVLVLAMSFYGAYVLISGLHTQATSLEDIQNELNESGLDQVAKAFAMCNRGENQYRDTYTLDGCKKVVLGTQQGSDNSRVVESIFQKYELQRNKVEDVGNDQLVNESHIQTDRVFDEQLVRAISYANAEPKGLIMNYCDYIEITPGKRGGKPCLKGMRITVYDVLDWMASGMSQQEILEDYPELSAKHVMACLAYAADRERHVEVTVTHKKKTSVLSLIIIAFSVQAIIVFLVLLSGK